tara:strand:+ start:9066 stop:9179 length:114 start_codon:yes stop_codon:yes gene_type:complete
MGYSADAPIFTDTWPFVVAEDAPEMPSRFTIWLINLL